MAYVHPDGAEREPKLRSAPSTNTVSGLRRHLVRRTQIIVGRLGHARRHRVEVVRQQLVQVEREGLAVGVL